jgi:hypothetical protein
MELTKRESWEILRICKKFKGLGGKVQIDFEPGKIAKVQASATISGEAFVQPPTLDRPNPQKEIDVQEG